MSAKIFNLKKIYRLQQRTCDRDCLKGWNSSILQDLCNLQFLDQGKLNDEIASAANLRRWPHYPDLPPHLFEQVFCLDDFTGIFKYQKAAICFFPVLHLWVILFQKSQR